MKLAPKLMYTFDNYTYIQNSFFLKSSNICSSDDKEPMYIKIVYDIHRFSNNPP